VIAFDENASQEINRIYLNSVALLNEIDRKAFHNTFTIKCKSANRQCQRVEKTDMVNSILTSMMVTLINNRIELKETEVEGEVKFEIYIPVSFRDVVATLGKVDIVYNSMPNGLVPYKMAPALLPIIIDSCCKMENSSKQVVSPVSILRQFSREQPQEPHHGTTRYPPREVERPLLAPLSIRSPISFSKSMPEIYTSPSWALQTTGKHSPCSPAVRSNQLDSPINRNNFNVVCLQPLAVQ
jgi:hypothetical protein